MSHADDEDLRELFLRYGGEWHSATPAGLQRAQDDINALLLEVQRLRVRMRLVKDLLNFQGSRNGEMPTYLRGWVGAMEHVAKALWDLEQAQEKP